jgi:transcription regulator MmyB-like protein/helix-turn-helix protein
MDHRSEVREFLTSRRARITPREAGLPAWGAYRRVSGLRREEVASLAGVSVVYYTRLERGNLVGASDSVLEAIARALRLSDAEREHLFDLARTANAHAAARSRGRAGASRRRVGPAVRQVLDAITETPADVRNGRRDILAANKLGFALYSEIHAEVVKPPNAARFTFLNPRARDFFPDWDDAADMIVANLRTEAGRSPYDKALSDLVGELSTRSDEFRVRWAAHNVRQHTSGGKRLRHPVAGELELAYQVLELPGEPGLTLNVYTAQPDSPSQEGLRFLASWADERRDDAEQGDGRVEAQRGVPDSRA